MLVDHLIDTEEKRRSIGQTAVDGVKEEVEGSCQGKAVVEETPSALDSNMLEALCELVPDLSPSSA